MHTGHSTQQFRPPVLKFTFKNFLLYLLVYLFWYINTTSSILKEKNSVSSTRNTTEERTVDSNFKLIILLDVFALKKQYCETHKFKFKQQKHIYVSQFFLFWDLFPFLKSKLNNHWK